MSAKVHSIPAYQRIQSSIRKRIDAGQLRPGDPVSSERDLAKLHEVSLMTARHALATLQGDSLFAILEREYDVKLGYADEVIDATAADPRTAELLNVPRREPLLRIRQLIYSANEKPLIYVLGIYRSDRHNLVIRRFR